MGESAPPHSGWVWMRETQWWWIILPNYSYYYKRMNVYKREGQAEGRLQCRSSGRPGNNVPVCRSLPVYNTHTQLKSERPCIRTQQLVLFFEFPVIWFSLSLSPPSVILYTCDCVCFFFLLFVSDQEDHLSLI